MNGLVIWAQSDCRSTMGLYDEVRKLLDVPVVVVLWFYRKSESYVDNRMEIGFSSKEFVHIPMIPVGENYAKGVEVLNKYRGYTHLFTVYQASPVWRKLIKRAKKNGDLVLVGCEAPCNMDKGRRKVMKEFYLRFVLPFKAIGVVRVAKAFFNYSGNDDKYAKMIGWPTSKIIPFGYYPPPIPGSSRKLRKRTSVLAPLEILTTGVLSRYRGADVLVEALRILKNRAVPYHATITQNGELFDGLRAKAKAYDLPIDFVGFVEMKDLIRLYETCDVYVGAGRHEPWGMRLNDALQCGTPLVVSEGMGGVKMISDCKCGLSFKNGNASDLADKLERLAKDSAVYDSFARNAYDAAEAVSPRKKAEEFIGILKRAEAL